MRSKDGHIQVYTSAENSNWLKQRADDLGCSVSEYVHELIQKHVDILRDHHEYSYDESKRLDILVDEVYDETELLLEKFLDETGTRPTHQPGGLHLAVLWKLLAGEYSNADREYAIKMAREDIDDSQVDHRVANITDGPAAKEKWRNSISGQMIHDQSTDETASSADVMTADRIGDSDE